MNKQTGKTPKKDFTHDDCSDLHSDLKRFGYLLPTNEDELEEFNKIFGKTQVMFPDHLKNPDFLKSKRPVKTDNKEVNTVGKIISKVLSPAPSRSALSVKPTKAKNDYFKKLVLAAEIANQLHKEPTFGHVKFVKVQYLCDQVCSMHLSGQYAKFAAGPLDGKWIHQVDSEFTRRKWFTIARTGVDQYAGYQYSPGEKVDDYKKYYQNYFKNDLHNISILIDLFRSKSSDFCEIVATIFYLWKEHITGHKIISNASLIKEFYEWNEKKKRFSEKQIEDSIVWMKENEIVPVLN